MKVSLIKKCHMSLNQKFQALNLRESFLKNLTPSHKFNSALKKTTFLLTQLTSPSQASAAISFPK